MNIGAVSAKLAKIGGPKVQTAIAKVGQYSPQILTAVGIVGGVSAAVMGARATLKLPALLDNHQMGKEVIESRETYISQKEHDKDVTYLYARTSLDIIKLYGPAVALGAGAIVCVVSATVIQTKRQVALVAALEVAQNTLANYRARVAKAIGEEKEQEVWYGIEHETIEQDGKKVKVTTFNPDGLSEYIRYFEPGNPNWQKGNRELNFLYIKNIQNWANEMLEAKGYVYLNDVYKWLGVEESPAGQVVGWLHDAVRDHTHTPGDGYIDFGVDNVVNQQAKRFRDGLDEGILLDFNVDGEINSKL